MAEKVIEINEKIYRIVTPDEIKEMIMRGEEINLDGCYIKDFSYASLFGREAKPLVRFHAKDSYWDGNVDFSGAIFEGENVDFSFAHFGIGRIDFTKTVFGDGDVLFHDATFEGGDIDFNHSQFGSGEKDFSYTTFGDCNMLFYNTQFGNGDVLFENAYSPDATLLFDTCTFSAHMHFDVKHMSGINFLNCTNQNTIDFRSSQTDTLSHLVFINMNNMGNILIDWGKYQKALQSTSHMNAYRITEHDKAEEFKMLKENFHNQGQYDWEDAAYVEFKKLDAKTKKWYERGILNLLYAVGRYGTAPGRVFISMLMTVGLFGALYYLPWMNIYPKKAVHHAWSPIYYSVITFFTIGYGDLSAQNGITAFLCGLEGFLGVFLTSYFSVALVRKILR